MLGSVLRSLSQVRSSKRCGGEGRALLPWAPHPHAPELTILPPGVCVCAVQGLQLLPATHHPCPKVRTVGKSRLKGKDFDFKKQRASHGRFAA